MIWWHYIGMAYVIGVALVSLYSTYWVGRVPVERDGDEFGIVLLTSLFWPVIPLVVLYLRIFEFGQSRRRPKV